MRKIWCFENLKMLERELTGFLKFFFLIFKMEREREEIGGERESISANQVVPHHPLAVGGAWPTREQRVLQAVGPTASSTASPCGPRPGLSSRALPRFFGPYLGYPNSDFESVSGLRTVTLSRMMTTIQL